MNEHVRRYNDALEESDRSVCDLLAREIDAALPESENKVWHGHPVWFLDGNPVAGYSKLKGCVRLLFWSGRSFDEPDLKPEGTFQAAEARYGAESDVDVDAVRRWLAKSRDIQWDYKNIVKRKGVLLRLGEGTGL
ncbi:MAG: DUF1801 domain-containing protein [Armatimonadetes bacterium]|nr:DUF1801 domain-containing protein [Armatimonadota bacterium]